jgi:NAD(P)-dependent dehydrogenase (short-subunit alcohol dehydrogenase family)
MSGLVNGKVTIVTGAAGIGEAICKIFARHGAAVVLNGLPGDPVDEVVQAKRDVKQPPETTVTLEHQYEGRQGLTENAATRG